GGPAQGGTWRPDRERVRLSDPGAAAKGGHRGPEAASQRCRRGRPLPLDRQPREGRAGRRARLAKSGLPTGAADGPPSAQAARTGRRRSWPEIVADGSRPCRAPRASPDVRGAAGTWRHGIGPFRPTRATTALAASVDPTEARKATVRRFGRSDR